MPLPQVAAPSATGTMPCRHRISLMLYWRWRVPLVVAALGGCGDYYSGRDDGGTRDDAGVVDAAPDAPVDAAIDAPPRCGDQHLDPGELCDGVVGLSGDGCSPSCTTESSLTWTNLTPSPIPERMGEAMAYDSAHHRLVVFGGRPAYNLAPTNDTWEWTAHMDPEAHARQTASTPRPLHGVRFCPRRCRDVRRR